jgi:hypothetical protein
MAFQQFLAVKKPAKVPVPPTLAKVLHFLEHEQDKCPGLKVVLSEIIHKRVLGMKDPVLAARLLLDFEGYVACVSKAQDRFFSDKLVTPTTVPKKPESKRGFDLFGQNESGAQRNENE